MRPQHAKPTPQEEALMKQLVSELGSNTPLAKATMAEWKAQKSPARRIKPISRGRPGALEIPLDQLEDSPYQLRHDMDSDALGELTRSIEENGLLNPILVRRKGDKYEVISGHRRLAAYRRLQFAAKSEKEKRKYGAIPARELPSVTDEQMLLLGLTENLLRADISPLDAALGLLALQKLKPALKSARKLSEATGLQFKKVARLLQLADSPEVVQQGVREGITVPAGGAKGKRSSDDGAKGQHRTLDLLAALQFTRLHEALAKTGGKGKDGASSDDKRTRAAIEHALKEGWGFRDVKRYVDKLISDSSARGSNKVRAHPTAPFKKTSQQLVIYFGRLEMLTAPQKKSLRKTLEEIIRKLK
jgi:ParB family chromosome partitioning protein